MKYHINFNNEHTLSFEILDNTAAHAWVGIMQNKMSRDDFGQKIFRSVFPSGAFHNNFFHFNNLKYNYQEAINCGLDPEFELKLAFNSYSHQDFLDLSNNIDRLFKKVVNHNFYYAHENNYYFKLWTERLLRCKDQMIDTTFNPSEHYARIKLDNEAGDDILITDEMRKHWIECARPKLVIRLCPNFDLKSLNILEQRNDPKSYKSGVDDVMHYITSEHKICYYDNELNQQQADKYMKKRRSKILEFTVENKLSAIPGYINNANFVLPVVAHCINEQDFTKEQLEQLFMSDNNITSEFEN